MKTQSTGRALLALLAAVLALSGCAGGEMPPSAFPGLLIENDSAYLASNHHLYKFNLRSGEIVWKFPPALDSPIPIGPFSGVPLKYGDWIVIGGSTGQNGAFDKNVYAVSAETGAEVWRFTGATREFVDGVVSDGKLIYAPSGDGSLYALDPNNRQANNEPQLVWKFTAGNRLWSRPLLADGRLYQGSLDHNLYAIDAATGKELWRFEEASASIGVQPTLENGVLYFGSFDRHVYAVNAADGSLKWKTQLQGWVWTEATLADGLLFVGDVNGRLYALDAASGRQVWFLDARDAIKAQPVRYDDLLYMVSMDTFVYALDPAGNQRDSSGRVDESAARWRNETLGRRLVSKPVLWNGTDLVVPLLDSDIKMWTVDARTGARKMQFPPATSGGSGPG